MKIGILGGSFNPAHYGHRYISLTILNKLSLDQIWWIVTPQNPHKNKNDILPIKTRVKIAHQVKKHPKIQIKCLEKQNDINYSYLLIDKLIKQYPKHQFSWLMGEDNLMKFHHWKKWDNITKRIGIIVFPRDKNLVKSSHCKFAIKYKKYFKPSNLTKTPKVPYWTMIRAPKKNISATEIRRKTLKQSGQN